MPEMDHQSPKPPPISEMLSKFALSFKTKAIEFFAEEEAEAQNPSVQPDDDDAFISLLDSAEEVITGQRVVVIKPDEIHPEPASASGKKPGTVPIDSRLGHALISSIFASVSSFQASYLQLQAAHVPLAEDGLASADKALVLQLRRLSELKQFYRDLRCNRSFHSPIPSSQAAQVQENQSKLRSLGTVSNQLQVEIDAKDARVALLRKELEKCRIANAKLSKRLAMCSNLPTCEVLRTVSVFHSVLSDTVKSVRKFTKVLIGLMKNANWDLDSAASWVHPDIAYEKKGHTQYAFLSYICLLMMKGFNSESFGLRERGDELCVNSFLTQLTEHISRNPMDVLSRDPICDFSRFCEIKYQELIHPTMETSIFGNLKQDKAVVDSWKSLSVFYESFVHMGSSVWTLHKLAFSFNPVVEIFQVETGSEFSHIYMEDVIQRSATARKSKEKVGFTVVPGFKIGKTLVQCQVYLTGMKCKESE
uniref:DUF641 domain-containing protein n=1 Tax=Kalanchoe fedtschenkoi TaxID=63787 RepID=A0A7N0VF78_KALFE